MTFTRTLAVILGLGLVGLVGACGDDDDDNGTPDAAQGSNPDAGSGSKQYTLQLTRAQEVPLCNSGGAAAGGDAVVTISADGSTIQVMGMFANLSGAANAMHIHAGAEGAMGNVVLNFGTPATPFNKTFTAADYVAAQGAPATFAAFVTELKSATPKAYINVHTTNCSSGEIRGQIK